MGNWSASAYVDNITNERGQEFITGTQFVESVVVDSPLTGWRAAGLQVLTGGVMVDFVHPTRSFLSSPRQHSQKFFASFFSKKKALPTYVPASFPPHAPPGNPSIVWRPAVPG